MSVIHDTYKAKNDSTKQMLGDMYRVSVAIEAALKYLDTDKYHMRIEQSGDITIFENDVPYIQIETKHHIGETDITPRDLDFWKTIKNWIEDYDISSKCKELIFYTTSVLNEKSLYYAWNRTNARNRFNLLKKSAEGPNHGKEFSKYYKKIFDVSGFDETEKKIYFQKRYDILKKITIMDSQPHYQDYQNYIIEKYDLFKLYETSCASAIYDEIHKSLSHYKPKENNKWIFNRTDFNNLCKHAFDKYPKDITTPSSYVSKINVEKELDNEIFLQEIKKLKLMNEEITLKKSFSVYKYTKNEIVNRFRKNSTDILNFHDYEKEITNTIEISQNKYINKASRSNEWINESQDHYFNCLEKDLICLTNFHPDNSEFQQGTMHWIINNKDEYRAYWSLEDYYEYIRNKKTDIK